MTQRGRLVAYLAILHAGAGLLGWFVVRDHPVRILILEVALAASLAAGIGLVWRLFAAFSFVEASAGFLDDGDLTTRFREVGQPEVDRLIGLYNRMVDSLRAERTRLQEREFFLGRILDASPSGVVTLDFDGRVAYANPAARRLLGAAAEDPVTGRPLQALASALGERLATLEAGDARVFPLWGGRRVRGLHGRFMDRGFQRSFFLIEELTDELRALEKSAYERIIRLMSHEVNNTVGASNSLLHSSLTYAAQLDPESREDFEHAIRVVIGRTERLNGFLRGFADVFRLRAPARQPCDVVALLNGVARLLAAEARRRGIEWQWEVEAALPPVALDPAQMEQVFVNVCRNAMEAIDRDGTITVRAGRRGDRGFVAVEDSGPGLSDEARANLFTPFFSTKEGGQGIGLTLVQEILTQHGFGYAFDSRPGGPTQFTVEFPVS